MKIISKVVEIDDIEYIIQSECDDVNLWLRIFVHTNSNNFSFKDEIFNRDIIVDLEKDTFKVEWFDCDKNIVIFGDLRNAAESVAEETFRLLKKVNKMKAFL